MQITFGIIILEFHRPVEKLTYSCSPGIIPPIFPEMPSINFTTAPNK